MSTIVPKLQMAAWHVLSKKEEVQATITADRVCTIECSDTKGSHSAIVLDECASFSDFILGKWHVVFYRTLPSEGFGERTDLVIKAVPAESRETAEAVQELLNSLPSELLEELAKSKKESEAVTAQPASHTPAPKPSTGFDDMDDDIPF